MNEQKIELRMTPKCGVVSLNGKPLYDVTRINKIKYDEKLNFLEVTMTMRVKEFNLIDLDGNVHSVLDFDEVQECVIFT